VWGSLTQAIGATALVVDDPSLARSTNGQGESRLASRGHRRL